MMLNERKITMKTGKRTDDLHEKVETRLNKVRALIPDAIEKLDLDQLKQLSTEDFVFAIQALETEANHISYQFSYETDYWLDFVTSLIKADKIKYHEWADSMPWAKHKAAEMMIERLIERIDEINWSHQQQQEPVAEPVSILDELRKKTAK